MSVPPGVNATQLERCATLPPLDQFLCIQDTIAETPEFANLSTCDSGSIAIPVSNNATCPLGMYCPLLNASNPATYPQVCPPTLDCQILRLSNTWCEPQGRYEPAPCLPGHFCPNSSAQLPCPAGTWCVRGTVAPRECAWLTHCPAQTTVGRHYGGALLALAIDLLILAAYVYNTRVREPWRVRVQAAKRREKLSKAAQIQAGLALSMPARGGRGGSGGGGAATSGSSGASGPFSDFSRATVTNLLTALHVPTATIEALWNSAGGGAGGPPSPLKGAAAGGEAPAAGGAAATTRVGRVLRMTAVGGGSVRSRSRPPSGSDASSATAEELKVDAQPRRALGRAVHDDGTLAADDEPTDGAGGSVLDRIVTSSATMVLEYGFRKCNAGLTIDLQFDGLGLTLPPPLSKTILHDVSGRIYPGRVTAVMGPSGAGKTTFLSVLMGKVRRTCGTLRINGTPDEISAYRAIIGFVPQEDTMLRELTVRENILFSARVRLPRHSWSDSAVQRFVDAVIEVLGLSGCADTPTSLVSGGQRKRCNIGMELAVAPAALFLDEPTSGLDSAAALEVCRTLRSIADLGLTVVAVIHQPRAEIFRSIDDLLLLAPGGHTVFMGPTAGTLPYFSAVGLPPSALLPAAAPAAQAAAAHDEGGQPAGGGLPQRPLSAPAAVLQQLQLQLLGPPVLGDNNPADELLDLVAGTRPLRVTAEALAVAGFAAPAAAPSPPHDDAGAAGGAAASAGAAARSSSSVGGGGGVGGGSSNASFSTASGSTAGDDDAGAHSDADVEATAAAASGAGGTARRRALASVRNPLHAAAAAAARGASAGVAPPPPSASVVALQGREVAEFLTGRWKAHAGRAAAAAAAVAAAAAGADAHAPPPPHPPLWQTLRLPLGLGDLTLVPTEAWFKSLDAPLAKAIDPVRPRAVSAALLEAGGDGKGAPAAAEAAARSPQRVQLEAMIADRGATPWRQLLLCHQRSLTQQYRQISWLAAECAVTSLAGMFMGLAATGVLDELYNGVLQPPYTIISPAPADHIVVSFAFYISMALGVAGAPAAVRTFGEERDVFLREQARGHAALAYYVAKNVSVLYRLCLAALHFAATFTLFAMPAAQFHEVLVAATLNLFGVYGMGTLVSMLLSRENAALVGVVVALILSCMCGFGPNLNLGRDWGLIIVQDLSYTRWMAEFWIHAETLPYRHLFMVKEVTAAAWGYELDRPVVDALVMFVLGCALRLVAFGGLAWVAWRANKGTR